MEVLLTKVAGVDVHKDMLRITTMIGEADAVAKIEHFECTTFTDDLEAFGKKLLEMGIKHVAMESTGIYWRPVFKVWHALGIIVTLGNAAHMKNVPGRKTDAKDAQWIAQLHRNGLIRASFVPEDEFQELRALTRHRKNLVQDQARVRNRIQKVLEDGNVKLGSILSNVLGVGGSEILQAIANGETNPDVLVTKLTTKIKRKEDLRKALTNRLSKNHCFLIKQLLTQLSNLQSNIDEAQKEIDSRFEKYASLIERLDEVPGIDKIGAQTILAEATTHMEKFKDAKTFAAWAGVAPGNNESAKKKKEPEPDRATHP
jgi:transposase